MSLSYDMYSSMLSLKFFVYSRSIVHTANIEIRECAEWSLKEVKNKGKSLTVQAQKVVAVAYRRWLFTRGFSCKALTGKILVF